MNKEKNTTEATQPEAAIDTARLLDVRADVLHLYQSSSSKRAKLHLMSPGKDQSQAKLLCGNSITGNLINDEVDIQWLNNANLAPEGLCKKCLKLANVTMRY